jgi:hypothetical protein
MAMMRNIFSCANQSGRPNAEIQGQRSTQAWCEANRRTCLVHAVEVAGRAVSGGVRVVAVRPHGGDGGVAALRHHAPQWPGVRQVAPQHDVLDQHVHRLPPAFFAGGGGVCSRRIRRGGCGAHVGSRRGSAEGEPGQRREEGGGARECGGYRGWQAKGKEGPHTCQFRFDFTPMLPHAVFHFTMGQRQI